VVLLRAHSLTYAIFGAEAGWLEVYQLDASDGISLSHRMPIDATGFASIELFRVWQGNKANRTGYWLRWWDESRQMLL